jgi:carboxyl-terminal processing protease
MNLRRRCLLLCSSAIVTVAPLLGAQTASLDYHTALIMLRNAQHLLRRHYYDSTFGGVNMDSAFRAAEARLPAARDNTERFAIIADVLLLLDDSHTTFWPPNRAAVVAYGFGVVAVGDTCYIAAVEPASDAWMKGIRAGDRLLGIERRRVTRDALWILEYMLAGLAPRVETELLVAAPDSAPRVVRVASRVTQRPRVLDVSSGDWGPLIRRWENEEIGQRDAYATVGDVLVWRLGTFLADDDRIREGLVRAQSHRALILDLRGNSGGYIRAIQLLAGGLLGRDTIIAVVHERRDVDTIRTRRAPRFDGELIVLTDHGSASASEVLAGLMRLYRRGAVVGDRTMGAVMTANGFGEAVGTTTIVPYGFSITVSDFRLPGGRRLEHVGVTPDEEVLPNGRDILTGRDPVLARALERLGQVVTPEAAGRLLPRRPARAMLWKTR